MAKLFPPYIEGTIPAFYANSDGTASIAVPYTMNRGVSPSEVTGFSLKIKTVQSSTYLYTGRVDATPGLLPEIVHITIPADILSTMNIGQFYKIQFAYENNGEVGQYSTVGVIKYTTCPKISIQELDLSAVNNHLYEYTGTYSQDLESGDTTERVYSYEFNLYNANGELVETSGEQLHNSSNDTEINESYDTYKLLSGIVDEDEYYLSYSVITQNGLQLSTPRYLIQNNFYIDPEVNASLIATLNYDNGYIQISLQEKEENVTASGMFLLSRGYKTAEKKYVWERLINFNLIEEIPNKMIYKDFTIEQGKTYIYSIQQYNQYGLYSTRLLSEEIYADFEDMFLYDGERQLKIRFNPKVSSFKNDILEQKMDTIGSKYPFFFRNGRVKYKEFPISGLISYYMDEEGLFKLNNSSNDEKNIRLISHHNEEDLFELNEPIEEEKTHNLTGKNFYSEREFKLEVLEWLNNGKPKLFRSIGEGNYLVRLMNISLSPNDAVGRMLHTFSATAYEIADCSFQSLLNNNIIKNIIKDTNIINKTETKTIYLKDIVKGEKINEYPITYLEIKDSSSSYHKFLITFLNGEQQILQPIIGETYKFNNILIDKIESLNDLDSSSGYLKFTQNIININLNFSNHIKTIKMKIVPQEQIIGKVANFLFYYQPDSQSNGEIIMNPLMKIQKIYSLKAKKRILNNTYEAETLGILRNIKNLNKIELFKYTESVDSYKYYDFCYGEGIEAIDYTLKINDPKIIIDLTNSETAEINEIDIIGDGSDKIDLSYGIIADISYKYLQYEYDITLIKDKEVYNGEKENETLKTVQYYYDAYKNNPDRENWILYSRAVKAGFDKIGVNLL